MDRANYEWDSTCSISVKRRLGTIAGAILILIIVAWAFMLALQRTIPQSMLLVDEDVLRASIASVYGVTVPETENIRLKEISRNRAISTNRDYCEYVYEYFRSGICYTGHLTVCYEYNGQEWILVSVSVTDLEEEMNN